MTHTPPPSPPSPDTPEPQGTVREAADRPTDESPEGELPVARSASPSASGRFGPRPIFDLADDRCPKCGEVMDATAVVCMKCGYDQRANVVREVQTGLAEVAEPSTTDPSPADALVKPSDRLKPKALVIAGGLLTVGAMFAAGYFAPAGASAWVVFGLVVLTLYRVALHTATGVAALAITAKLEGKPFGRGEFAVSRMFVCFALFQLCTLIHLPLWWGLSMVITWGVGAAAYFGAVMLLFRQDRSTALLIALTHFALWLLLNAGMELSGLVSAGLPKPAP